MSKTKLVHLSFVIVSNTKGMAHLKIIKASRGPIYEYENLKRKLHNCNADIYFSLLAPEFYI